METSRKIIKLKPKSQSSLRVRNRISNHGNEWKLLRKDNFNGMPAVLCESIKKDGYLAWFTYEEIDIEWEV